LLDGSFQFLNEQKEPLIPACDTISDSRRSWMVRITKEVSDGLFPGRTGGLNSAASSIPGWIRTSGMFDMASLNSRTYYSPINWDGDSGEEGKILGQIMGGNMLVSDIVKYRCCPN
jgi:hypothetical protein